MATIKYYKRWQDAKTYKLNFYFPLFQPTVPCTRIPMYILLLLYYIKYLVGVTSTSNNKLL